MAVAPLLGAVKTRTWAADAPDPGSNPNLSTAGCVTLIRSVDVICKMGSAFTALGRCNLSTAGCVTLISFG